MMGRGVVVSGLIKKRKRIRRKDKTKNLFASAVARGASEKNLGDRVDNGKFNKGVSETSYRPSYRGLSQYPMCAD